MCVLVRSFLFFISDFFPLFFLFKEMNFLFFFGRYFELLGRMVGGNQRIIHGGVIDGGMKSWTLCTTVEQSDFSPGDSDKPFILMVDRGDCTFASKVCLV